MCRNDAIDIKTFDSEHLQKLAEYYRNLFNCSFKSGNLPECEKVAFVRTSLKQVSESDNLKSYRPLLDKI